MRTDVDLVSFLFELLGAVPGVRWLKLHASGLVASLSCGVIVLLHFRHLLLRILASAIWEQAVATWVRQPLDRQVQYARACFFYRSFVLLLSEYRGC